VIRNVSLCAVFCPGMNTYTPQRVEEEERICAVEIVLCQKYLFLTFYFMYSKLTLNLLAPTTVGARINP